MLKKLTRYIIDAIILILLFSNTLSYAAGELPLAECDKHIKMLTLDESSKNLSKICREGYITYYDLNAKIPYYVSYLLTPDHVIGCNKRGSRFLVDDVVNGHSMEKPIDYIKTGYDRGHLSPASDNAYSRKTLDESFYMSNIIPQYAAFNRGIWSHLEEIVRGWSLDGRTLQIISGSIYNNKSNKIRNDVTIPTAFYKIIIDVKTEEYMAFYFPHYAHVMHDLMSHRVTINTIENATGKQIITNIKKDILYPVWNIDVANLRKQKKIKCG
jgi:endonuclease G